MSANNLPVNFSYASWTPNTRFKLCNVNWDMGYRDIVRFENEAKQREYFNSLQGVEFTECSMSKFGLPVRLKLPFSEACKYNYLIAYNDYDFDTPKYWYYFIQECTYINAYTTQLQIQLDVWQSFQFDVQFGRCYIERGHIGIANERQWEHYGRDYLDIAEGLDTGADGRIVAQQSKRYMDLGKIVIHGDRPEDVEIVRKPDIGYIIVSTVSLVRTAGTVTNPKLHTAVGSIVDSLHGGASVYYTENLEAVMSYISDFPWVSQGIIGVWAVPKFKQLGQPGVGVNDYMADFYIGVLGDNGNRHIANVARSTFDTSFLRIENFRDNFHIDERYRHLKKFKMFPYSYVELTMQNGNSTIIKPQYIDDTALDIWEFGRLAPPQPRLFFYPRNYNGGEDLNNTIGLVDFPKISVVNNNSTMYLASSAHSIQYAQNSADWAQNKTQMGINNAYAQAQVGTQYATSGANLANQNRNAMTAISNQSAARANDINMDYMAQQQAINQGKNLVNGGANFLGAVASGNAGGAVSALVGTASNAAFGAAEYDNSVRQANAMLANQQSTALASTSQQNAYNMQSTNLSNEQTMKLADMNKSLATAVAQGDYANTIAGINAKIQDSRLASPTIGAASGGDAVLLGNGHAEVWARFKRLPDAAMRNIGEFWLRFGYYVQRFVQLPDNLMCMSNFTYWKLHELYLRSSTCPEEYRLTIKGIFEKGVTVWNDPAKIGVTDYADNVPLNGIRY